MTPDTLSYMIAGFTVIFTGMLGYVISLALRIRKVSAQAEKINTKKTDH
jgi:CcmD family protein